MHPGQVPPCFLSGTAIRRKDAAPRRFAPYRSVSSVYLQCIFSKKFTCLFYLQTVFLFTLIMIYIIEWIYYAEKNY